MILEEKKEGIQSILKQPINHYSLHQIVQSYLYFNGYADTLKAFEKSAQIEREDIVLLKDTTNKDVASDRKKIPNGESKFDSKFDANNNMIKGIINHK